MTASTIARPDTARRRLTALLVVGAAAVLVSGYVHYYLYFEGGYRGIQPESVLGLTISRSFLLNAIAAVLIAELAVFAVRRPAAVLPAAVAGALFSAATLGAYVMSRTVGLLGFTESEGSTEAVIAIAAELVGLVAFVGVLVLVLGRRRAHPPLDDAAL